MRRLKLPAPLPTRARVTLACVVLLGAGCAGPLGIGGQTSTQASPTPGCGPTPGGGDIRDPNSGRVIGYQGGGAMCFLPPYGPYHPVPVVCPTPVLPTPPPGEAYQPFTITAPTLQDCPKTLPSLVP